MPVGKQRSSANAPDSSSLSLNEKILKECHELYTEEEKGNLDIDLYTLANMDKIFQRILSFH